MFETACNDTSTQFNLHAGDYTLFELGTFDQATAKFDLQSPPINHGLAIQHKHTPIFANVEDDKAPTPLASDSDAQAEQNYTNQLPHSKLLKNSNLANLTRSEVAALTPK